MPNMVPAALDLWYVAAWMLAALVVAVLLGALWALIDIVFGYGLVVRRRDRERHEREEIAVRAQQEAARQFHAEIFRDAFQRERHARRVMRFQQRAARGQKPRMH